MEIYQILILLLIYIIPVFYLNWFFKIAYSKIGRWNNLKKNKLDYVLIYFPIFNTIFSVTCILFSGPKAFNYTNKQK